MLTATNIQKYYGDLWVLKGVDLEIKQGEIASIVGPSGSGKSTLLHILGTLDKPDKGEVRVGNQRIDFLNEKQMAAFRNKHVGFVFQFHHLLPEFTALENVCIPGWMAGRRKSEVEQYALSLLQMLGLEKRVGNKPNALSGGEQQRVAVARALINKPNIIFADEPTGNLHSTQGEDIMEVFQKLNEEDGVTIIQVTHSEKYAQYGTRIIQLLDGQVDSDEKHREMARVTGPGV